MSTEMARPDLLAYRSVFDRAGWYDRSGRARLEIVGPDRAKFLHNLTTNDVKRLPEGSGHESFVTSPQGKVLAYVTLLSAENDTILLRTDADSLEPLLPHLNKYGVFDDVAVENASSRTFEYHVAGPSSGAILEALGVELPSDGPLRHRSALLAGIAVRVVRESPTGRPGITLIGSLVTSHLVKATLAESGMPELDEATFEALRIEAGTPVSGVDVSTSQLPQEVGRDSLAINFVKGCYLGQETVARLDALGHVNRILKGLRISGSMIPPSGTPLAVDGKVVGSITSSGESPGWHSPIALAYVRVAHATAGTKLVATIEGVGEFETVVADLPMLPPAGPDSSREVVDPAFGDAGDLQERLWLHRQADVLQDDYPEPRSAWPLQFGVAIRSSQSPLVDPPVGDDLDQRASRALSSTDRHQVRVTLLERHRFRS